ncbi:MAG: DUF6596 domain-containing protein [bacterium]
MTSETAIAQRLVRTKARIRAGAIPFETPVREELATRLPALQRIIYLLFNEGYSTTTGPSLANPSLAFEAAKLGQRLLREFPTDAETIGLVALMQLHNARIASRVSHDGQLVPLGRQDRTLWNKTEIDLASSLLDCALELRRPGSFQIQAAIACLHAQAPSLRETDWAQIVVLYDALLSYSDSPVVALNRAVAVAMASDPRQGLRAIDDAALQIELEGYHLVDAVRAELLTQAGEHEQARLALERAISKCSNVVERNYMADLLRKLN